MNNVLIEEVNFTMVPLSKKRALDLIDTVILPISQKIQRSDEFRSYFPDRESYLQHNIRMGHLAIAMLFAPEKAQHLMEQMHRAHARHGLEQAVLAPLITEFFQRYVAWCRMSKLVPDDQRERLEAEADAYLRQFHDAYPAFLQAHASSQEADFVMFDDAADDGQDDGFAFFEAEDVDAAISDMHTSAPDKSVISASEYMASGELVQEQINIIMDEFRELEELFAHHIRFDETFVQDFQRHLKYLADSLFSTFEFEQMGYSLQQLLRILDQAMALDEGQQTLIFTLLEQLVLDLTNWAHKLFVEQDAVDIHYLDAALLASIAQIEMMFGES